MNIVTSHPPTAETQLKDLPATIKGLSVAETLGILVLSSLPLAHANPTGGQVAAGVASIVRQGARMDINQASQRAVLNWQSFSIDRGEHVNFNQPGRDASTLNRVLGNDPSALMGQMTANGNVYLVNQNGIMVGKDAQINVGSLTASTANISTQDFMAGRMNFDQPGNPDARIVNYGTITAQQGGLVALVAPGVENHGAINAKLGKIALASGDAFTLDLYGDQLINLTVTQEQLKQIPGADGKPLSHYVSNTGEIIAEGGMVTIMAGTGKAIIDSLINLKGHVQAQSVENHNGVIILLGDESTRINVAGILDASGKTANAQGGAVNIRGGQIDLQDHSRIDVSAQGQGGNVLVGGDYQGSGVGVRAKTTTVAHNAIINADSKLSGDGGKVIVWADGHSHFDGNITARGGQTAGNGGLVEVSGKNTLHYDGDVDASAAHGKAGTLLLDPGDLTVKAMTAQENQAAAKPDANGNLSTTTDAAVNVQKVNFLLQNGTSVALKASNDLTVAAKINGRASNGIAGAGISLTAGRNANINDDIVTNNGAIAVKAETGNITMAVGKALDAGNKAINLTASKNIGAQHLVTTGAVNLKAGGAVTFKETLGHIKMLANGTKTPVAVGSVQVKAGGKITIAKDWNIAGNNNPCNGGDCSVKIIQTGGNDIVINGRIKTATGNILIGSDDYNKTSFTNQIHLGNSIFTGGVGVKNNFNIFINGNLHLVNSGRTDVVRRVVIEEITLDYLLVDNKRTDEIPTITLSAAKGSLKIADKGNISGLWRFNDREETPKTVDDYTNATIVGFNADGSNIYGGVNPNFQFTTWTTSKKNFGGAGLRLVAKDKDSLGFSDMEKKDGIPSARLSYVNENGINIACCKKDKIDNSYRSSPNATIPQPYPDTVYTAQLNQFGTLKNGEEEYHYLVIGGVIQDKFKFTTPDTHTYTNNATAGLGQEGPFQLSQFNQIKTSFGVSNPDPIDSSATGSLTRQTLTYANQPEEDQAAESPEDTEVCPDEAIILSSGSAAENADLGRNSPEIGATQDIYEQCLPAGSKGQRKRKGG